MSIMDIAANLMGSNPSAKMLGQVSEMITQNGGLNGLISKFQNAGLESHVNSWVGNGENLPVSAEQIKKGAFAGEKIAGAGRQRGDDRAGGNRIAIVDQRVI